MSTLYSRVADRLLAIEVELRTLQLWEAESPSEEALASTEPFCIDTLRFSQWLQFILLPRMQTLIEAGAPLPQNSQIAPMAEEALKDMDGDIRRLLAELEAFDRLLSEG